MVKRLVAVLVALMMAAAACGGESEPAVVESTVPDMAEDFGLTYLRVAEVNGEAIGVEDVTRMVPVEGDTMTPERFAEVLTWVILGKVVFGEAYRQFQLALTVEELDEAVAVQQLWDENEWTEEGLRYLVTAQELADQITLILAAEAPPEPAEDELREIYDTQPASYTNVCSSHILLETEEEGMAALERALAGEDFADLARELSTGPSGPAGGDLGCAMADTYVPEFAAATVEAPLGEPVGPVQTDFGWHVILVSERDQPSFEEARETLAAGFQRDPNQLWGEWWGAALAVADVTVEPQYGQWTPGPPFVIPPGS